MSEDPSWLMKRRAKTTSKEQGKTVEVTVSNLETVRAIVNDCIEAWDSCDEWLGAVAGDGARFFISDLMRVCSEKNLRINCIYIPETGAVAARTKKATKTHRPKECREALHACANLVFVLTKGMVGPEEGKKVNFEDVIIK